MVSHGMYTRVNSLKAHILVMVVSTRISVHVARVACASDLRADTWRQAFVETDALHKAALEAAAFAVRHLGCISAVSRQHLGSISVAS